MAQENHNASFRDMKVMHPEALPECLNPYDIHLSENCNEVSDTKMSVETFLKKSNRLDSMLWTKAYLKNPGKCREGWNTFIGCKNRLHTIPDSIRCDRTFLRNKNDSEYLEAAVKYLRGVSSVPPVFVPSVWFYPYAGALEKRVRAKNWAVGASEVSRYYKILISPTDWATFSLESIQGRFKVPANRVHSMLVDPGCFPELPEWLYDLDPSCHLAVEMPRMAYYFAYLVQTCDAWVKKRFLRMLRLEFKIKMVVSFMEEVRKGRVWDIGREHQIFLESEVPPFPEIRYYGDCEVPSELGDLENALRNLDLWRDYKKVMAKSVVRFRESTQFFLGKQLAYVSSSRCFDSSLLPNGGYRQMPESEVELNEALLIRSEAVLHSSSATSEGKRKKKTSKLVLRRSKRKRTAVKRYGNME